MNAWTLALANVTKPDPKKPSPNAVPKQCVICGETFQPLQNHPSAKYCSSHCKGVVKAKKEKAARAAAGLKPRGGYKPTEQCIPEHQHKVKRQRYWKEAFGNVATQL
jgi:hypothetical protein